MRSAVVSERTHLSIREVLDLLVVEFPDVTISKIRFLESQGLIRPERTPSGYRKFYDTDVERLRWILRQQREHFLPLKVIKGRLDEASGLGGDEPVEASLFDADYAAPPAEIAPPAVAPPAVAAPAEAGPLVGVGLPARHAGLHAVSDSEPARPGRSGGPAVVHVRSTGLAGQASALATAHDVAQQPRRVPVELAAAAPTGPDGPAAHAVPAARPAAVAPTAAGATGASVGAGASVATGASVAAGASGGADTSGPEVHAGGDPRPGHRTAHASPAPTAPAARADAEPARASHAGSRGGSRPERADASQASGDRSAPGGPGRAGSGATPGGAGQRAPRGATRSEGHARPDGAPSPGGARGPGGGSGAGGPAAGAPEGAGAVEPDLGARSSFSAEELAAAAGIGVEVVRELEEYGFIASRLVAGVPCYGDDALVVARLAAGFRAYGIESRHLRTFKHAAEREAGLFSQVVTPLLRQRNPAAHERAQAALAELTELGCALHASLVRSELRDLTGG